MVQRNRGVFFSLWVLQAQFFLELTISLTSMHYISGLWYETQYLIWEFPHL